MTPKLQKQSVLKLEGRIIPRSGVYEPQSLLWGSYPWSDLYIYF